IPKQPMAKAKPHKIVFVDAFAGCGGLSLGLMQAGLQGRFAIEHDNDVVFGRPSKRDALYWHWTVTTVRPSYRTRKLPTLCDCFRRKRWVRINPRSVSAVMPASYSYETSPVLRPAISPLRTTIGGFSRYGDAIQALPPSERRKIVSMARLLVARIRHGQNRVCGIRLEGHADQDTPRRPSFE